MPSRKSTRDDAVEKLISDPEAFLAEVRRRVRVEAERETDRRIAQERRARRQSQASTKAAH